MISIDPNLSSANFSFFPKEIPRISSNPDPESRVSKIEDGSSPRSPPSRSRVSESSDLSLSTHGFETGDMVWGRVQSHPWWPGYIFNEAFASPSVRRTKTGDHVLVAFFGDSSYGWFDPSELVPFASNFLEKSKQTSARSFLNAVEESVDEFSRRAALGLSCMCRNPYSFRPTCEPGYYAVDVPGFERGGIYSSEQIEMARKEFVPEESLSFVHQLALAPLSTEAGDIECVQKAATVFSLRKATFEEFDDTYAEAFGVQPMRPTQDNLDEEPEKFAPRVAPLSGPLVIPEPPGSKNNKSSAFRNHTWTKKNKYLLKRRFQSDKADDRKPIPMSSRPPPPVDADKSETTLPSLRNTQTSASVPTDCKLLPAYSKQRIGGSEAKSVIGKVIKEKIKKRPRSLDDLNNKCQFVEKKKKREGAMMLVSKELSTGIDDTRSEPMRTLDPIVWAPKLDLERLKWSEILHDLSRLALNPYYGIELNTPSIVRHVFLKFRSAVYQKSLVPPIASEADDEEIHTHNHKEPMERQEKTPNVKQGSLIKRYSDPSNVGTKRPPWYRTEEVSAKRIKNLDHLKKASVWTATDPSVRQEPLLPLPPKKFTPANLIMKFPPNSTLPSVSELKARFVRFGKLVANRCHVKWEEDECRVQFAYQVDALKAFEFATVNGIFGKTRVSYCVKEVKLPSKLDRPLSESQPESSSQFWSGNGSGNTMARPMLSPIGPLKSILKKPGDGARQDGLRVTFKLDGDGSTSLPIAAAVSVGSRDTPLLPPPPPPSVPMSVPTAAAVSVGSRKAPQLPPPPPPSSVPMTKPTAAAVSAGSRKAPQLSPPPPPSAPMTKPMEFTPPLSLPLRKPTSFLPISRAATLPMPPQPCAIHAFENMPPATFVLPSEATTRPMPPNIFSESHLRRQVQLYGGAAKEEESRKGSYVDVPHARKTSSVLHKVNDIVVGLQSLPGFVMYRAI